MPNCIFHTNRRLPQCIIFGVRKAGTRALLQYLNIHPDIVITCDEMHFFERDEKYNLTLEYYRKQMPYSFEGQITIEKTPRYFTEEVVPERIYRMNSSIKLLLIVRNPVDRLLSDYAQLRDLKIQRNKTVIPFEDEVLTEDGEIDVNYKGVEISMYYRHFADFLEIFHWTKFMLLTVIS